MDGPEVHLFLFGEQPAIPPTQDCLEGLPQMCSRPPRLVSQDEFPKSLLAACFFGELYHQTPPAQEEATCRMLPTPPPGHADVTGTLAASSSPASEDAALVSELQKMRLSGAPLEASEELAAGPIPQKPGDEVPRYKRQLFLRLFVEEYLKFSASLHEAQEKAQAEERAAFEGSPSKDAYESAALCTLGKLKGLAPSLVPGLSRVALYGRLRRYLLTENELQVNGYPLPHPQAPGAAVLFTPEKPQGSRRRGSKFNASPYTRHRIREEDIPYDHRGQVRPRPGPGRELRRYTSCRSDLGAQGCAVAMQRVQDGRKENLQGFVQTSVKPVLEDAHPGIYALDCKMSYTTQGLEPTRVTVVDAEMRIVYDTFVKPDNEIIDYNTRFSGVTKEDLAFTSTTLRDVQAVLLSLFNADTILIGHSLECDLLALKMIHGTVVDTAVLFSQRRGWRCKRSLRSLSAVYLDQSILKNVGGHSSGEDASACMGLVIWKVQQDAETSRLQPNSHD